MLPLSGKTSEKGGVPGAAFSVSGPPRRRLWVKIVATILVIGTLWITLAYAILPPLWRHREYQPGLAAKPMLTRTTQGISGDPINVGLVGSKTDLIRAMRAAGWAPADAITLLSSFKIGASVALDRSYPGAPISTLLYDGKPQALAFERTDGRSAKRRHHVRFWLSLAQGKEGRPVWLGAASFDRGVGFSRYTGQITHHIGPDLDAERAHLMDGLTRAKALDTTYRVAGIGPTTAGFNGGGDLYFTDGDVAMGVLASAGRGSAEPRDLPDTEPVVVKNRIWSVVTELAGRLHVLPTNQTDRSARIAP